VQAVVTLRSGRQVDSQVVLPEENPAAQERQGSGSIEEKDAEPSTATPTIEIPPMYFVPKASYPDRLLAPKKGGKFEDILEVFKQVQNDQHPVLGCHPASTVLRQVLEGLDHRQVENQCPEKSLFD
jgi:hypothetical protein